MACKRQQEHVNHKLEAMFSRLLGYFSISNIVYTVLWMLTTIISTQGLLENRYTYKIRKATKNAHHTCRSITVSCTCAERSVKFLGVNLGVL